MYTELKGIDYVLYINKTNNRLNMLDLINNRNEKVQNTGDSWNNSAYGNCLITLENAKATDALYLLTKSQLSNITAIDIKNTKEVEEKLLQNATKIIRRKNNQCGGCYNG